MEDESKTNSCPDALPSVVTNMEESAPHISSLPIHSETAENGPPPSSEVDSIVLDGDCSPEMLESDALEDQTSDDPHQTIMSACSTVGELIRRTIAETLKTRGCPDDANSLLQAAMIEKLGNFESSFMSGSDVTVDPFDIAGSQPEISNESSLVSGDTHNTDKEHCSNESVSSEKETDTKDSEFVSSSQCTDTNPKQTHSTDSPSSSLPSDCKHVTIDLIPLEAETGPVDSDKSVTNSLGNSTSCTTKPQCGTVCNVLRQCIGEVINESFSSGVRQSIEDVLSSKVVDLGITNATSHNLVSSLEDAIIEKLENFKNSLIVKCAEALTQTPNDAALQAEAEETSSLSGEADAAEKDCAEETDSKNDITNFQNDNGDVADNKICSVSDTAALKGNKAVKKSQRNGANKKKGEKTIGFFTNQILKSLSSYSTNEEKLNVLSRKHAESLDKFKTTEIRQKQNERQVLQLVREKEQLQAEHNRNVLAKSRLESLCRELQRQNKAVKEESLLRIREEEEKRKEVASKFQSTLNEISSLMQENSKKNLQLKEENAELAQKLKTLVEHYEMWEKHMEKVVQQKDLEAQLAKAKHAKTNLQLKQETECFLREKQTLLENMTDLQKKCSQLASNELLLRGELSDYTSKYEEFQTVLNKSNQVFATFKTDMDSTSKKIKKLEKETNIWKQKWETSNAALVEMITDKQTRDKELKDAQQRVLVLQKLCRVLQAERNDLQNQVKEKSVEENGPVRSEEGAQAC